MPGRTGGGGQRARQAKLDDLRPPRYLADLAEVVRTTEPELWAFFGAASGQEDLIAETRQHLLESSYRLDPGSQPDLFAAVTTATERLDIKDTVHLYQAQDGGQRGPNAAVISFPGEAHVVFSGPLLDLLDGDDVAVVLGHELAHHLLWRGFGDTFWVLDRLVHAAASDMAAAPSHVESARLLRLNTEVFADRGALVVSGGNLAGTVEALVKIATGLRTVSGTAYLEQSAEIIQGTAVTPESATHPETFLRTWALQQWSEAGHAADEEISKRLAEPLDIDRLDVLAQHRLTKQIQNVVRQFLSYPWAQTDAILGQSHLFGVTPPEKGRSGRKTQAAETHLAPVDHAFHDVFSYILLDLATTDDDVEGPALAAAMELSTTLGLAKRFDALVAKELSMTAKDVKQRRTTAAEVLTAAEAP